MVCVNVYFCENEIEIYNGDDSDYEECDVGFGEILCEEDEEVELVEGDEGEEGEEEEVFEEDDVI